MAPSSFNGCTSGTKGDKGNEQSHLVTVYLRACSLYLGSWGEDAELASLFAVV
ncbi:hypothetical protein CGRA01v4_07628 [Colletotrichum graminicola]|nr:hypothetical protein CGRA01v4_07628 [Colletotrichum graminicola]